MREILFRGKSISNIPEENGRWVYGLLWKEADFYRIGMSLMLSSNIDQETIGQYTGLNDKEGVKIFEGDILVVEGTVGEVYMEDCRYSVGHNKGSATFPLGSCLWRDFNIRSGPKIIGNIHDNPELLVRE